MFFLSWQFGFFVLYAQTDSKIIELKGIVDITFIADKDNPFLPERLDTFKYFMKTMHFYKINDTAITNSYGFFYVLNRSLLPNINTDDSIRISIMRKNIKKRSLEWAEHYRDLSIMSKNPIHTGGDIYVPNYETEYHTLKIMYNVTGYGIFADDSMIDEINLNQFLVCAIPDHLVIQLEKPTLMLLSFDSTSSLTEEQMKLFNVSRAYHIKRFWRFFCE